MASGAVSDSHAKQVQVRVSEVLQDRVDALAHECSSPGRSVSRSDVFRAAFRDYLRKHRSDLDDCEPWKRGEPGESPRSPLSVKFLRGELKEVEKVAHECSSPGRSVSRSDVLRAALRDYTDKHDGDLRVCEPSEMGTLSPPSGLDR